MPEKIAAKPVSWARATQFAIVAMAVIAVAAALEATGEIAVPICAALVVALTLGPASDWLGRRGLPPITTAVILVIVLWLLLAGASILLSGPLSVWIDQAPQIGETLERRLMFIIEPLQAAERFQNLIRSYFGDQQALSVEMASPPIGQTIIASLSPAVGQVLVFLGTLLFLLIGRERMHRRVVMAFEGRDSRLKALRVVAGIQRDLGHFFAAVTLINAGLGLLSGIVFVVIGLPNAILWGTLVFGFNFIPFIGPLIIAVLLGVAGLVSFDSFVVAALPAAAFLVLNFVESQFVTPTLLGKRFDIDPLVVFLAIIFGTWLWGPAGSLLATPLLVIAVSTYSAITVRREAVLPG